MRELSFWSSFNCIHREIECCRSSALSEVANYPGHIEESNNQKQIAERVAEDLPAISSFWINSEVEEARNEKSEAKLMEPS